mmetsp:Transcript_19901/g.39054  ORF Transcript_19901/g.39054 Transcript_19901/m.39054 type:complete len:257 (+) Transcript_19901:143-913(+)|eukprot:CAMPEP_0171485368 /NCGR_PEP_ID=MMETSP0958-20121227/503_1 /TAXON_ID=87120 /ORGANISM="Aurantiochytrium limacinum, Strain ATCCMYA-1381" /LENGTH=256 /DNA_ID=CAMNT_0012018143 /DNA_START=59 /DNA_END=829 /DNA_ORIENTATION=+
MNPLLSLHAHGGPLVATRLVSQGTASQASKTCSAIRHLSSGRRRKNSPWISRQAKDPFVAARETEGFRSRSAFKLEEMDRKLRILKNAKVIVDLGAAPGGWTQVAVKHCKPSTKIIMCDLLSIKPIDGCVAIQGDFLEQEIQDRVRAEALAASGTPYVDVVLSDMAPNTIGNPQMDHLRQMELVEAAWDAAQNILHPEQGSFLVKIFQGSEEPAFAKEMKKAFREFKRIKPSATRQESREVYFFGRGFCKKETQQS